jgi:hypothetical protein
MARSSRRCRGSRPCQHPQMDHGEFWRATVSRISRQPCSGDWRTCRRSQRSGPQGPGRDHGRPSHAPRCATRPSGKPFPDVPGRAEEHDRNRTYPSRQNGPLTPRHISPRRKHQVDRRRRNASVAAELEEVRPWLIELAALPHEVIYAAFDDVISRDGGIGGLQELRPHHPGYCTLHARIMGIHPFRAFAVFGHRLQKPIELGDGIIDSHRLLRPEVSGDPWRFRHSNDAQADSDQHTDYQPRPAAQLRLASLWRRTYAMLREH